MRGMTLILTLLLSFMALSAPAQTRPVVSDDPYKDMPLPLRHGPTTQTTSVGGGSGGSDVFDTNRLALALGVVLVAMFVAHRIWKKLGLPGVSGQLTGVLQVVSRLSVSPKQQILLVRVGRRLVLVGNSGNQMNSLCEIGDAEEAAAILGQNAVERDESVTTSFNAVLDGEEKHFEEEIAANEEVAPEEDSAIATTRAELSGLAEKVRSLSNQFRQA